MKLSELITILQSTFTYNGDMEVVGIVDGQVYSDIDINCPDSDSPMYIELYMNCAECKLRESGADDGTCVHYVERTCPYGYCDKNDKLWCEEYKDYYGNTHPTYGGVLTDLRKLPIKTKFFVANGLWYGEIIDDDCILVHAPKEDEIVALTDEHHSLYLSEFKKGGINND